MFDNFVTLHEKNIILARDLLDTQSHVQYLTEGANILCPIWRIILKLCNCMYLCSSNRICYLIVLFNYIYVSEFYKHNFQIMHEYTIDFFCISLFVAKPRKQLCTILSFRDVMPRLNRSVSHIYT